MAPTICLRIGFTSKAGKCVDLGRAYRHDARLNLSQRFIARAENDRRNYARLSARRSSSQSGSGKGFSFEKKYQLRFRLSTIDDLMPFVLMGTVTIIQVCLGLSHDVEP